MDGYFASFPTLGLHFRWWCLVLCPGKMAGSEGKTGKCRSGKKEGGSCMVNAGVAREREKCWLFCFKGSILGRRASVCFPLSHCNWEMKFLPVEGISPSVALGRVGLLGKGRKGKGVCFLSVCV